MPTYDYRCAACGRRLEAVQKFSDAPLTECPECHAQELRRVFGNVGVVLKGSGFYRTDNRKSANGSSSSTSDSSSSKDSKDSSSSSSSSSSDSGSSSSSPKSESAAKSA